jgi:hypothetical protein
LLQPARLELVRLRTVGVQPAAAAPVRDHRSEEGSADAEQAVIVHGRSFLSAASATLIRSIHFCHVLLGRIDERDYIIRA